MKHKLVTLLLSVAVIASLMILGCAPEVAPPVIPPEEEEEAPPAVPEAEVFKWTSAMLQPSGEITYTEARRFFEEVIFELTAGRLQIKHYAGGAVVPINEELDALNRGVLDCASIQSPAFVGALGPATYLFDGAPAGPTMLEQMIWFDMQGNELMQEMLERAGFHNVVHVNPYEYAAAEVGFMAHKPIVNPEDVVGLKLRTYGLGGKVLGKMGCSVVTLPGAELYEAVQRGVVDACELACPTINITLGLHEILEYWHLPGIHSPGGVLNVMVNRQKWEELPKDIQLILKEGANSFADRYYHRLVMLDVESVEWLKDYGTKFVHFTPEFIAAYSKAADEVYKEIAAEDEFFAKVYSTQTAFLKSLREGGSYVTLSP